MAGMLANFVSEQTNAPGTNLNVVLAGANIDRIPWSQVYTNGSPVFYFLDDGGEAEWGVGTFHSGTPNFISRDTVIGNTAGNTNRLNFTGAAQVYNEVPGERLPYINGGLITAPGAMLDTHAGGVPIGAGMDYYCTALPIGWVWANGQALSRVSYATLFAKMGTAYGAGDGVSTFNVPNKQEVTSVGRAGMGGASAPGRMNAIANVSVLGAIVGDQALALHSHNLNWSDPGHGHLVGDPGHIHDITDPGHAHSYSEPAFPTSGAGFASGAATVVQEQGRTTGVSGTGVSARLSGTGISVAASLSGITASIGTSGSGSQQNVQPSLVCNHIIYAGPVP